MSIVRNKIQRWAETNPDRLLESFEVIGKEVGVATGSVNLHLPQIVASKEGIMPSDFIQRRDAFNMRQGKRTSVKTYRGKVKALRAGNPDMEAIDIAYLAGCSPNIVRQILREGE